MPNRAVSGWESRPARVVAPTSVKGWSLSSTVRARGPGADDEVELAVLEGGIEDLLDGRGNAVDLVDEEDVARAEVRQDRGEVPRLLEDGARRHPHLRAHLPRDDVGERRLPEARGAEEEDVVERLAPPPRGRQEDAERLLQLRLADELPERRRPERDSPARRSSGSGTPARRRSSIVYPPPQRDRRRSAAERSAERSAGAPRPPPPSRPPRPAASR